MYDTVASEEFSSSAQEVNVIVANADINKIERIFILMLRLTVFLKVTKP